MDGRRNLLRVISKAGEFRRGGHRFGPEAILLEEGQIETPEQLLAIVQDERLDLSFTEDGETFVPIEPDRVEQLRGAIETLRAAEAHSAGAVDVLDLPIADDVRDAANLIPDPAGSGDAGADGQSNSQTEGAPAADGGASVDTSGASTSAAGEGGSPAGGDAGGQQTVAAIGATDAAAPVEGQPASDPVPAPVAAPIPPAPPASKPPKKPKG